MKRNKKYRYKYKEIFFKKKIGRRYYWFVKYVRVKVRIRKRKPKKLIKVPSKKSKALRVKIRRAYLLSKEYLVQVFSNIKIYSLWLNKEVYLKDLVVKKISLPKYFIPEKLLFTDKIKNINYKVEEGLLVCLVYVYITKKGRKGIYLDTEKVYMETIPIRQISKKFFDDIHKLKTKLFKFCEQKFNIDTKFDYVEIYRRVIKVFDNYILGVIL